MKKTSLGIVAGTAMFMLSGCFDADFSLQGALDSFKAAEPTFKTVSLKKTGAETFVHIFTSDRAGTAAYGGQFTGVDTTNYGCVPSATTVEKGVNKITLTVKNAFYQSCTFKVSSVDGDTDEVSVAYIKLSEDGKALEKQGEAWVDVGSGGNESDGSQWTCIKDIASRHTWLVKHAVENWNNLEANVVAPTNATAPCGKADWRVPNLTELSTLLRANENNLPEALRPYYNNQLFPDSVGSTEYWTNEEYAGDITKAWSICFFSCGEADFGKKNIGKSVRLMR